MTKTTHTSTDTNTADILEELGMLPPDHADDPQPQDHTTQLQHNNRSISGVDQAERRLATRFPTSRNVRLVMLAGAKPLGDPFHAKALDVSKTGVRLQGQAPFLHGGRAAIELKTTDGRTAILGAAVKHTTFGKASKMTEDLTSSAGFQFFKLDEHLVQTHFATPDGDVSLTPPTTDHPNT